MTMSRSDRPPTAIDELRRDLAGLKLEAMLAHLDEAIEQASQLEQGYSTFVAGLVRHEVLARTASGAARRITAAKLPVERTRAARSCCSGAPAPVRRTSRSPSVRWPRIVATPCVSTRRRSC